MFRFELASFSVVSDFGHTAPLLELVDKLISYVVFDMIYFTWRRFVMIRTDFWSFLHHCGYFPSLKARKIAKTRRKLAIFLHVE